MHTLWPCKVIDYIASQVAKLFFNNVVNLHGVPQPIVSYKDKVFNSQF